MSPIELILPAGQTAPTPAATEPVDAAAFAGLLDVPPPGPTGSRGRLGAARWLGAQTGRPRHLDGGEAPLGLLVVPGQIQTKPVQPLINPGPGSATPAIAGTAEVTPIAPGVQVETTPAAEVAPSPTKTTGPLVLPIIPGIGSVVAPMAAAAATALQALAVDDQAQSVGALVQAAQQAVGQVPEFAAATIAVAGGPAAPAPTEAEMPAFSLDPQLAEAMTPATANAADGTASAATSVSTATGGSGALRDAAVSETAPPIRDAAAETVDAPAQDAEVEALAARVSDAATTPALARSGAEAVAGRMSFDALAQVSAQIIRRLETRTSRFEMQLNPLELGRVDVRLDIDAEGRLAARLAFDNPAAAVDLRGRVDDLRRELQQAGFQLADDAFSFTDRGSSGGRQAQDDEGARRAHARSGELADQTDAAAQPALRAMTRLGLDVRV